MTTPGMKRGAAWLLQVIVVLAGVAALAFLLGEPHLEGRNAHATAFEIYFNDPFLAYVYGGSIPFFVALWSAFGALGDVRRTGAFSLGSVQALRTIKRCALILLGFVAGAAVFIVAFGDGEDRPAGVFMCGLASLGAGAMALVAARLARAVQGALGPAAGS